MNSWELVCLIGFIAFLALAALGILPFIHSNRISQEQEPHERAAYIKHLQKLVGKE